MVIKKALGSTWAVWFMCLLMATTVQAQRKKNNTEVGPRERRAAESLLTEGEKYFLLEDYTKAYSLFLKALEVVPDNAAVHFKIAQILLTTEEADKALYHARKSVDLAGSNKYYYLLLAEVYVGQGNFKEAIEVYEAMMANVPGTEEYLYELAALQLYEDDLDGALETYEKAQEHFGPTEETVIQQQKILLRLNRPEDAVKTGMTLVEQYPGTPEYVYNLAELFRVTGQAERGVPFLESLLTELPDEIQAKLLLADLYWDMGKRTEATDYLEEAFLNHKLGVDSKVQLVAEYLTMLPNQEMENIVKRLVTAVVKAHPEAWKARGIEGDMHFALGNHSEAGASYLKAVALEPAEFDLWQNILAMDVQLNRFDSLVNHTERALEIFPNQALLYYYNGVAHFQQSAYEDAVWALEQGKRRAGGNTALQGTFSGMLGDAYHSLEQYAESDAAYEEALKYDPEDYTVLNNYSYYLALRGEKLEAAREMSARLIKAYPEEPNYLDTHAWVLYTQGDYKEAKRMLERALAADAKNGTIIEHYGDVLFKLGQVEEAVIQWKRAKGMDDTSDLIDKKIADRKLYEE